MRRSFVILALSFVSLALGQRCETELQEVSGRLSDGTAVGVVGAELLAAAVHLVEPALPELAWPADLPLEPGEPGYDAVRYLAGRGLLPAGWRPEELPPEVWGAMLSRFTAWYELPPVPVVGAPARGDLVGHVTAVLEQVSGALRPVALLAADAEERSKVAFLGLVWNWTVYPRLIVRRPGPELSLDDGVEEALDELGNCVVEVEHYVFAPEEMARSLFLTHSDARMYVVGSEPEIFAWPLLVPEGEEEAFFAFESADVSGLTAYAAAFSGGQLSIRRLMAMLPRLRTNLLPTQIPGLLRTPATR